MEKLLNQLTEKLKEAFGQDLVSVILYGSAAAGDFHQRYSDLNILCILRQVSPAELEASEPVLRWWREKGNPAPLLLSEEETRNSTDCFAAEFHDILECRRVLFGADVIEGLAVDDTFYRAQVEHELRAKLLRLRTKAAGVLFDAALLTDLMSDSVSTFLILGRHALKLSGVEAPRSKREIARALSANAGIDTAPFERLLDVRESGAPPAHLNPRETFAAYLNSVRQLVDFVDALSK
jgi:hypothetical protein